MKHNFFAGPAILPQQVLQEASKSARDFNGMGLSILEISHRSKPVVELMEEAEQHTRDFLGLNDDWAVLFLTGGASSQFFMTACNLLAQDKMAAYVDTGTWSTKAIKEAKLYGEVRELASSRDKNYNYIPKGYDIPSEATYLHLTSNNTIYGTQIQEWPDAGMPIVADMSSDIFSRPLPIDKFGLIYAGAQKNLGPAGTTLVMVRKDLLGRVQREIPTMLDYRTHIKKSSAFNTPPVYPIYVCMLTMRWIKENGGLSAMAKRADHKAGMLYGEIDRNPLFKGTAATEDRSKMNVCFVPTEGNEGITDAFLKVCADNSIMGLKGHRSVGGFRASIYNAMEPSSVEHLVQVMQEFERTQG